MAANEYHFVTRWRIAGTLAEIGAILEDAAGLARWWPSVYLGVDVTEPGDARGVGRLVSLYTKGWLPYTLRWHFRITEVRDDGFALEAHGDFEGRGVWTFAPVGGEVDVVYDWRILAEKPLLRNFSFVMKPLFAANHRWAMRMGEASLKLELARRHARTPEERAAVPPPPPPTPASLTGFLRSTLTRRSAV